MSLSDWSPSRRRDRHADEHDVDALCWSWRTACIGSGLCNIVTAAAGPTEVTPKIVDVTLGPPTVFLAELLPGQIPADVRAVAHRLAPHLGAVALRIEPRGLRHVRIECLAEDPLVGSVDRARPVRSARDPVMIGRDEQARPVPIALADSAHLIVQGSSGSGKSTAMYGFLGQVAPAPDVLVVGSDITGKLLEPWATRPGMAGWHALGTRNLGAHVRVLERCVREMDRRIEQMPPGHDSVQITTDRPLILMVIEEFPGLVRLLATTNKELEKTARSMLARLFGESRKAGMRLLLIAQRADANLIGGFERDQCSHAISFRVGSLSALSMLHADADKAVFAEHSTAQPGIALLSAPGDPLRRFRAPLTDYATYYAEVVAEGGARAA